MYRRLMLSIVTLLILLTIAVVPAAADGFIIPEEPEMGYLAVKYHRVAVDIEGQIATTHIDQVFVNDSPITIKGTYLFPLPETAAISEFTMWVDGRPVQGEILERDEARQIYDDIVRRQLDPALLEYIGRDLFQASIFPIPPGEERRIELEYVEILPAEGGLIRYVYPLSTEQFSPMPLQDASITVNIASKDAIKAVYSPSHPVTIDRPDDYSAITGWEDFDVTPDTDFSLFYTVSTPQQEEIGVNLVSFMDRNEGGFFALLVAPPVHVDEDERVAKDVMLVLDTSGSMEGEKLEQAQEALSFVLNYLHPEDRFNIVQFSTSTHTFADRMMPASVAQEGIDFVQQFRAEGSTDINRAMLEAMDALTDANAERPGVLIFLTDGLPTAGVVETDLILNSVKQAADANVRVFTFGLGDDVDTFLLDTMARDLRGASAYVRPDERIDEQVSTFYAKISTPVLSDINLDIDGVWVEDVFPYPLPDLFAGSQLVLVGRYRSGGSAAVTISGTVNGRRQSYLYDDLRFSREGGDDFLPRLWATRQIGYLLNQIRLHGEEREMVEEIVDLSIRYGIITPYTSFLVEEPHEALSREGRQAIADEAFEAMATATPAPVSGAAAVDKAMAQTEMEEAAAPITPNATYRQQVRTVGDRAFVLQDGVWTDTTFDPERMSTVKLSFGSEEFLEFLAQHPQTGRFFSLGEQVIVVIEDTAYETVSEDAQSRTIDAIEHQDGIATAHDLVRATEGAVESAFAVAGATPARAGLCLGGLAVLLPLVVAALNRLIS
jgi:Ca-activated chloride channel homolog